MALHKLVFDATDADTIAASANVGAYLRSADGTLLTHTDVGGKKALDVRVAEGINVEVDLNAADDSVASWTNDGAGNPIGSTGGALHISDAGGSLTVDATDFDIRDLSHTQDSVKVGDGSDFLAINADGSINITDNGGSLTVDGTVTANQGTSPWVVGDGGGSLTVDAVNLDIRDLAFATDKVDVSGSSVSISGDVNVTQGTSPWVVSGSVTVNDAALANSAIKSLAQTVTASAAQILAGADELASRKYVYLYNNGSKACYIGESGVTASSGFPIFPGSLLDARIGDAVDLYMISQSGSQDIRTMQLS